MSCSFGLQPSSVAWSLQACCAITWVLGLNNCLFFTFRLMILKFSHTRIFVALIKKVLKRLSDLQTGSILPFRFLDGWGGGRWGRGVQERFGKIPYFFQQTSQELRMLSSVTLNCQVTKILMDSGSQLSELLLVSQVSQVTGIVHVIMVRSW